MSRCNQIMRTFYKYSWQHMQSICAALKHLMWLTYIKHMFSSHNIFISLLSNTDMSWCTRFLILKKISTTYILHMSNLLDDNYWQCLKSCNDLQARSSIWITSAQHMQDMCHCSDLLWCKIDKEKNNEKESESASY